METLSLHLEVVANGAIRILDNIDFTRSVFVMPAPGSEMAALLNKSDGLLVFDEIARSLHGPGLYLMFTDASGIADAGGWEGVEVYWNQDEVVWLFDDDNYSYHWVFNAEQYKAEVEKIQAQLSQLSGDITLQPNQIFPPESWDG